MNRRLVPSPACVMATGRRGFRFGKARTVFSGSGEVSTGSAANKGAAIRNTSVARRNCRLKSMASKGMGSGNWGTDIIAGGGGVRYWRQSSKSHTEGRRRTMEGEECLPPELIERLPAERRMFVRWAE